MGRADDRGAGRHDRSAASSHDHEDDEAAGTAESRDAFADLPDGVAHLAGRSRESKLVHVAGSPDLVGRLVRVRVDHAGPYALRGALA